MKHVKKAVLTSLLLPGMVHIARAQNSPAPADTLRLSLAEIWQKADIHSRAIHIKQTDEAIRKEDINDAEMERFPEINVAGSMEKATNIPVYEHGLFSAPTQHEVIHTLYKAGADFYLNIYNGNKLNLKIAEDKLLLQLASIKKEQAKADVHYSAAARYLELQKATVFKTLIVQSIAEERQQLAEIKNFQKNGVVLKSDVLRVELDLSRREVTQAQIENDVQLASQKLNILIGEADEQPICAAEITDPHSNPLPAYEACITQAMQHAFATQVSAQQTAISKLRIKEVKANTQPQLGMYGSFYYANPQIFLYPYNPYWYSLGVAGIKASFSISSLYHNIHKVKAANLELEKEEETHKDVEDQVRQQVKEAFLRYQEALLQVDAAHINVAHARENERIIRNSYFNQTSLITDLLDAGVQVLQSGFELEAARIMAQNRYYLLQNIIGTL